MMSISYMSPLNLSVKERPSRTYNLSLYPLSIFVFSCRFNLYSVLFYPTSLCLIIAPYDLSTIFSITPFLPTLSRPVSIGAFSKTDSLVSLFLFTSFLHKVLCRNTDLTSYTVDTTSLPILLQPLQSF